MRWVERVWHDQRPPYAAVRAVLSPLGVAYGLAMRARRALYDRGLLRSLAPGVPVISVGNLTVGGTGKTPVAAWLAGKLRVRATPAVVLRGYGADEVEVHRRLNPGVTVIASPDRLAAVREARRAGADVVVADDAFQHRRLRRSADIVLLSVEQWRGPRHCLPAGPWREPVQAARLADLVIVTRKSASAEDARVVGDSLTAEGHRVAVVRLLPEALIDARSGARAPLDDVRGRHVLAIAGIGNPAAFADQLTLSGARVELAAFRDHHTYTASEAARLAARVPVGGLAICTLKDAVKLAALWPASSPLWYVSQHVVVEKGAEHVDELLERVLATRAGPTNTAG